MPNTNLEAVARTAFSSPIIKIQNLNEILLVHLVASFNSTEIVKDLKGIKDVMYNVTAVQNRVLIIGLSVKADLLYNGPY